MTPPDRRRLPVWIWDRILTSTLRPCSLCGHALWTDSPWTICRRCDRAPGAPLPPNYR
ncbi:hypothetical protein [Sphaerisporangium sp. TRM90804]|uniref:hypothetical protein n=1 Tax=Sphaerisporangium sp. TRM90804 TaxID=3031113 RepID=UPI00244BD5DA|nr:hypothetical protein [Sphaerisporangium sp. TRM90804]MDH2425748.1 hypothetical protein [Sphaerisporangium sp. TRM90804]